MVDQKAQVTASDDVTGHQVIKAGRTEVEYLYDNQKMLSMINVRGPRLRDLDLLNLIKRTNLDYVGVIRLIDEVSLIDLISRITLIDTISAITNIANINSVDLIDKITLLDRITLIDTITNIGTLAAITNIVNVASVDLIDRITLVDTIAAITNIANIVSLDLVDRITLIDSITNIGTLANLTNLGTVNLINTISAITNIANLVSVDLIDRITLIDAITNIGTIGAITTLTGITNPINVKTSGGTNIVLDALTQGAYTERRSTLSNEGAAWLWYAVTGNNRFSKFFPRGSRGFVSTIDFLCRDNGAAGGTITVYLSPTIGSGVVYSATVTVPAGGAQGWRSAVFNKAWNYDSIFIFFVCSSNDIQGLISDTAPYDSYSSSDAGVTWSVYGGSWFIHVNLAGETCGDVPVSGIVNNIEIPNTSSRGYNAATVNLPDAAETTLYTWNGAGKLGYAWVYINMCTDVWLRVYADGNLVLNRTPEDLSDGGFAATTPKISLLLYVPATPVTNILLSHPYSFKQSLSIRIYNGSGGAKLGQIIESDVELIS